MELLAAALAFLAIGGIGFAFAGGGQPATASKRVKAAVNASKPVDRRKQAVDNAALKRKQSRKRRLSVKGMLAQAGLSVTPIVYWILSGVLGFALAFTGLMLQGWIGAAIGLFVGLFGIPRWVLGFLVGGRQKKFANQLADGIDVIVRGVKSGLPLGQCLRIIASESAEPLRTEFQALVDSQAMGVPLDVGLQRMYDHMPMPEVNFFNIVLIIQQKTGGNLSESLGNLSAVLRSRKLMKEKVKALSSEAKASAMIIGALPIFVMGMVYFTRPQYLSILFTDPVGNFILICCVVMMSTGIFVMQKMVNFKF
jgi:tight adherence protein B